MKRSLSVILVLVITLCLLVGCGGEGAQDVSSAPSESSQPSEQITSSSEASESDGSSESKSEDTSDTGTADDKNNTNTDKNAGSVSDNLVGGKEASEDAFFSDAVFIGDSVMLGFKNYCTKKGSSFLGGAKFLASGSFAVRLALDPVSEDSLHPVYSGAQHQVWDSVSMMGAKKVFICLGINDVAINGVDGTVTRYDTLINKIKDKNPDAKVYVMSTTFCCKGGEKGKLNNKNLGALNEKMKEYCKGGNAEYVEIMDYLSDGNGNLADKYCSDNYIHQTTTAYNVWVNVLREFAKSKM